MAKKKKALPELSPEAVAANAAGEARREKEKEARRKNAEKQARFREGMKAEGYKRVTLWEMPCPADKRLYALGFRQVPAWEAPEKNTLIKSRAAKVKIAVNIRESSLNAADRSPEIKKALASAAGRFLQALGSDTPEKSAVYSDYLEIIKLFGGDNESGC